MTAPPHVRYDTERVEGDMTVAFHRVNQVCPVLALIVDARHSGARLGIRTCRNILLYIAERLESAAMSKVAIEDNLAWSYKNAALECLQLAKLEEEAGT